MKIVHSLWSKPGQKRSGLPLSDINKSSWMDKRYNYFSWTLSLLQFKKYYDQIELVTDKKGYDLLINKLELPYTNVKILLDDLNHYHPDIWAIGKLYTYSIQEEPFIHVDGDVFIWEKFDEKLESSSLLCQKKEEGNHYSDTYLKSFWSIVENFKFYPDVLHKSLAKNNCIKACNAGVIGGYNLEFFKVFCKMAFEFIDRNIDEMNKINIKKANIIFEQFLFSALVEERGEEITYFNPNAHDLINDYADYTGIPDKTKFIHTPGSFKEDLFIVDALEHRLLKDYPDYYYKIVNLIKTNQI
jgi:hypothetical protein